MGLVCANNGCPNSFWPVSSPIRNAIQPGDVGLRVLAFAEDAVVVLDHLGEHLVQDLALRLGAHGFKVDAGAGILHTDHNFGAFTRHADPDLTLLRLAVLLALFRGFNAVGNGVSDLFIINFELVDLSDHM